MQFESAVAAHNAFKRAQQIIGALLCALAVWSMAQTVRADDVEEAYALNQEAMVDMSMAEFESAARKFLKAAALVPDYGVKDRNLRYTPIFMAAWAFEKIGDEAEACRYFRRFLEIASPEDREPTKVEHAQDYLSHHCGS